MFSKEDERDTIYEKNFEIETKKIFSCFHESLKCDYSNFDAVCYHPNSTCKSCAFLLTTFIIIILFEPLILIIVCIVHSYNFNYLAAFACCISSVFILRGTYGELLCTCLYNPCCQFLFFVLNCLISISSNIYCYLIYFNNFYDRFNPGYDILFFIILFCNIITAFVFLIQFTMICCNMCEIYSLFVKRKSKDMMSKRILNSSEDFVED